jgi:hypothetical protein
MAYPVVCVSYDEGKSEIVVQTIFAREIQHAEWFNTAAKLVPALLLY